MSFSSELEYIVAVLNDERLLFQFEDSSSIDVPREVVSSSTVLQQALSDAEKDEDVPFYCPKGYLQSWLRFSAQDAPFAPERLPVRSLLAVMHHSECISAIYNACSRYLHVQVCPHIEIGYCACYIIVIVCWF